MNCKEVNDKCCPKKECVNNGVCCKCVERHREAGNLPFCLRPKDLK